MAKIKDKIKRKKTVVNSFLDLKDSPEVRDIFRGSNHALDAAFRKVEQSKQVKARAEKNTPEHKFSVLNMAMTSFDKGDFSDTKRQLDTLASMHLSVGTRQQLLILVKVLIRFISHERDNDLSADEIGNLKQEWKDTSSNIANALSYGIETVNDVLNNSIRYTELPHNVEKPVIVENAQIVANIKKGINKTKGLTQITSNIYLADVTLIGVPKTNDMELNFKTANKKAMKKFKREISPDSFTRPDSDGVWFAVFNGPAQAEQLQFPESLRRSAGYGENNTDLDRANSKLKTERLKKSREAFEKKQFGTLFDDFHEVESRFKDSEALARELSSTYMEKWDQRWQDNTADLTKRWEGELRNILNNPDRELSTKDVLKMQQDLDDKIDSLNNERDAIVSLRQKIKELKLLRNKLNDKIQEKRYEVLQPSGKEIGKLSRMIK